jgi:hypothetical protein
MKRSIRRGVYTVMVGSASALAPILASLSCSDGIAIRPASIEAGAPDVAHVDPEPDAPPVVVDASPPDAYQGTDGAVEKRRFSAHVDYNGPVANAVVTELAPESASTLTDSNGDFVFYAGMGSSAIAKVEAPSLYPMIRGIVIREKTRIRQFYLAGTPDTDAWKPLDVSIDTTKGVVEVDFRNSSIGGYDVVLHSPNGDVVTPGFVIAYDLDGNPQLTKTGTITGGDGSTLVLGNVPPGTISFVAHEPNGAPKACTPCDAPELPVQAGTVTWFDFECGDATDCL